eukprot:TRINITY_DN3542_c0_g1_i2.p1 TRINITY_DN3542_c0_g1~~TRINITY_DN3542_c0_g1_i2.p1  ORF type:complete len:196 (+),score=19.02 TRINITY_DN3542_c0_g1_i2:199-786(+)
METALDSIFQKGLNFDIIGKSKPVLQIVLLPNQRIITRSTSLMYCSENVKGAIIKENVKFIEKIKNSLLRRTPLNYELFNVTEGIEYIGLSRKRGKIICLNPLYCKHLYIREENVLAYTISNAALILKMDSAPYVFKKTRLASHRWLAMNSIIPNELNAGLIFLESASKRFQAAQKCFINVFFCRHDNRERAWQG